MDCTCIRQTDLPHTTRLFADLVYHPDRVRSFYPHIPQDPEVYAAAASAIDFPDERRQALVAALAPLNPGSAALERLAQPGTVAVVTGQQVGLFSGPAYTLYKALTAVRLARELSGRGIPAVPVFWLATEDHDFAEVNHTWVFDAANRPVKLEMQRSPSSTQPVGQFELLHPPVDGLRAALAEFPFGEETVAMVEECYRPGVTLGAAFGALLRRILGAYDVLQVDPMSPAFRALAAEPIRAALRDADGLAASILERNGELAAAGYHAQVHLDAHTSFVFLLENGKRLALRRQGREYILNGRRFSTEELMDRADRLSPNALLRPVVQDSMFPTVAYVGGPAELAYLAQSAVIYRALLGRMPVALPRTGFTLLDERSRKLLERYKLQLTDFFHGEEALRERLAARLVPPALAASAARTRDTVEGAVRHLNSDLTAFDPTLAAALEKSRRKIAYQLDKIERKTGREALARNERAARDAQWLNGLIYPDRHLQERLYSILPFLARHGSELVDVLYANVRLECPDHQLLVV